MKKISLIICSRKSRINSRFSQNIAETIGCEYEIITVDNSENNFSIFEAYNIGIERSNSEFLVFIHDDILFHTSNWGVLLQNCFRAYPDIGLIGVAGSKVLTRMPSPWWSMNENVWNVIQHFKNKPKEVWTQGFDESEISLAAAIDGVFMAMRKDDRIRFDERLKGFHNYDLQLSVQHHVLKKKVAITNQVLLEHFSEGALDRSWYKSAGLFRRLYKKHLPIKVTGSKVNDHFLKKKEVEIGYQYLLHLIDHKLFFELAYWWLQLFKIKSYSKFHLRIFRRLINKLF